MILAFSPTFGLATATAAVLLYGLLALASKRLPAAAASAVLLAACFFQALALAEGLLGDPPRFGFAPALSMTVWMVVLVYEIESKLIPELRARWALPQARWLRQPAGGRHSCPPRARSGPSACCARFRQRPARRCAVAAC